MNHSIKINEHIELLILNARRNNKKSLKMQPFIEYKFRNIDLGYKVIKYHTLTIQKSLYKFSTNNSPKNDKRSERKIYIHCIFALTASAGPDRIGSKCVDRIGSDPDRIRIR